MSIELVPLATAVLTVAEPLAVGTAIGGTRLIYEITDAVWSGAKLNARQEGKAAADWALASADGIVALDVRSTLRTDDGALIFVHYRGRIKIVDGAPILTTAPLFEAGDPRYAWLNGIQALARGTMREDGKLVYEIFEAR